MDILKTNIRQLRASKTRFYTQKHVFIIHVESMWQIFRYSCFDFRWDVTISCIKSSLNDADIEWNIRRNGFIYNPDKSCWFQRSMTDQSSTKKLFIGLCHIAAKRNYPKCKLLLKLILINILFAGVKYLLSILQLIFTFFVLMIARLVVIL